MPVSHAAMSASASSPVPAGGARVPGLLEVLARVPDPRQRRGRRFELVKVITIHDDAAEQ